MGIASYARIALNWVKQRLLKPSWRAISALATKIALASLWIERHKKRLLIYIAIIGGAWFIGEYLNAKYNQRVSRAFDTISTLSSSTLLQSRMTYNKLLNSESHKDFFKSKDKIDDEYTNYVLVNLFKEDTYSSAFFTLHIAYDQIAWCALTRLCDMQTVCVIAGHEIQDFNNVNKAIYARWNDATKRTNEIAFQDLNLLCDKENVVFSSEDHSLYCSTAIYIRGILNLAPGSECASP